MTGVQTCALPILEEAWTGLEETQTEPEEARTEPEEEWTEAEEAWTGLEKAWTEVEEMGDGLNELLNSAGKQPNTRPDRPQPGRDDVTDVSAKGSSKCVHRSTRLRRTPLRISRIGKYRPVEGAAAPSTYTSKPTSTPHIQRPAFNDLNSAREAPIVTSVIQSHTAWPAWRSPRPAGATRPQTTSEPESAGEVERQVERTTAVTEVPSTTELSVASEPHTERRPMVGPEPAGSAGGEPVREQVSPGATSGLTERLEDISARIQLVRQRLARRLDSQMR